LPKLRGFKSHADSITAVYTGDLQSIGKPTITPVELAESGYIDNPFARVKIIAKGELNKKVIVKAQFCSKGALKAIQSAGGKFERIERMKRPQKESKKSKE
jgi:large subunit ribosomal protein L15